MKTHVKTLLAALAAALIAPAVMAHGISGDDQAFLINNPGTHIGPYIYLGAKHMVTGYDHLLFLAGVIFFLYRLRDVALYVTLFAVGHSTTLLIGVLGGLHVSPYIVDAIIGLSVVYKAFDNIGGFKKIGWEPNAKAAVLIFGFFHGFGLSTKLQDLAISEDGLVPNMISFNIGVEIGQFLALALILIALNAWRATGSFMRHAYVTNVAIMSAGFMLMGYQITGYFVV
ncbi:MAG: HupE/UreJ family protein [Gammaproteobacteria bacterium]|nr:HupE/UreJ family protein [Gammaproteobacteria bacterium]